MNKSFHLYLCLIGQQQGKCPSTNYKGIDKSNPEGKSFINILIQLVDSTTIVNCLP